MTPYCFCHRIGHRLIRQHGVLHRLNALAKHCHIHLNGGFSQFLAGLAALTVQCNGFFTVVAILILRINMDGMRIGVAGFGVRGVQIIFHGIAGRSGHGNSNAVHGHHQSLLTAVPNGTDNLVIIPLAPGADTEIVGCFIDDHIMVTEAGPEPNAVFTSLFIGNVDGKRICFSCITLRCYRECVFTAFFVIQKKRDRILCFQGLISAVTGLITGNLGDLQIVCRFPCNCHGVGQTALSQLIRINRLCGFFLAVFADDLLLCSIRQGITHLKTYVRCIADLNGILQGLAVSQKKYRDGVVSDRIVFQHHGKPEAEGLRRCLIRLQRSTCSIGRLEGNRLKNCSLCILAFRCQGKAGASVPDLIAFDIIIDFIAALANLTVRNCISHKPAHIKPDTDHILIV